MRTHSLAGVLALAVALGTGGGVRAQVPGSGWTQPNSSVWNRYAPSEIWLRYAPGYSTIYATPTRSIVSPRATSVVVTPGAGWQGYTAGTAWQGYAPATAWVGYRPAPNRPGELYSFRAGDRGIYNDRVVAIAPTAYREFGTGRRIPLSKPWLPNSP